MLREIHISNFKSLKNVSVPLKRISFFCGPNASGKSNLADALDFLSHVFRNGIQHAVAQKGGFYNICFRRIRRAKGPIRFRILGERTYRGQLFEFEINFSFRARTEAIRSDFLIEDESYVLRMKGDDATRQTGWIEISRQDRAYIARQSDGAEGSFESGVSRAFGSLSALNKILAGIYRPRPQQLLLGPLIEGVGFSYFRLFKRVLLELEGLRVFQISPRTARQAGVPSVTKGMGLHGENLAVAVASFLENKRLAPRLLAWMQDVVPELSNLQTGYTETKQIGLFLQERGFGSPWYAEDLSDGTIMALALFVCLLEPTNRIVVIEEPENSLHPWILKRFLDRCREVSEERQILVTTHSPLTVSFARPDELFLIERREGATEIVPALSRDANLHEIIAKNLLDLGNYWLSGGIGGIPEAPDSESLPIASDTQGDRREQ